MKKSILLFFFALMSWATNAQQFPKAILPGDYPDPTILRDGKDYYMTHSPFIYTPGFLIWHSQNLINWEPVCRALTQWKGSAMAPDLVKYKDKYYIYFPADKTNWVTWATDIKGPWSDPIDLKVSGIDPGHLADAEGNRYLYVDNGYVIRLSEDGLSTIGERQKVYDGWAIPSKWNVECMCLESPKLSYNNGYYYLTSAEGGTAGPATSHMVVAARSKSPTGPWENSPYNPVIHTYNSNESWWSKGHGTLIDDVNGNLWMVYHAYANNMHTLGRQTLIEPMEWTSDGWYLPATTPRQLPAPEYDRKMELSDNFDKGELGLQWTFWKEYEPKKLSFGKHALTIEAKGTCPANGRLLLTTATDNNYIIETEVTVGKGAQGGLLLYYSDKGYAGVTSDGNKFTLYTNKEKVQSMPNSIGRHFKVRIHNRTNDLTIEVSKDGKAWQTIADNLSVKNINHNNYGGFFALRPTLCAIGKGKVTYHYFKYENGVPTENDMSAYLMVFHRDNTHGLYMALSRDGYHFTALNDANPIMAGDTIANQKGIRDPHIYRGPDGAFYLAMTDLHIYAQREGKRNTEWERDGKTYGWGNNKGLVLMKSWDLIHWSHKIVDISSLSPEFAEIGCAWAPETIYDEKEGKLMIYFTMRFKNLSNRLYYVYVNDEFNELTSEPKLLFEYPDHATTAIDGDICQANGKYILSYVAHEGTPGIKQAVSDQINGGFRFSPRWIDEETKSCEAPTMWKRIGEEKWVLMYDCYGIEKHNFGFEETSDFVNYKQLGHFNDSIMFSTNFDQPKHGAVVHLTDAEARTLAKHWGLDYETLPSKEYTRVADKPLYRDPVYDGAADPIVVYNKQKNAWWMFYTSRRANMKGGKGVEWVHGTPIGIAESKDGSATWNYLQDANINYGKDKDYTYWAPDIVEEGGNYHMFLTVVPGVFDNWKHPREIVHLQSTNLVDWTFVNKCELASDRVIDASLIKKDDGTWLMYYNNEADGKSIYYAESKDLVHWTDHGKLIRDKRGEGPKAFRWKGKYFMIVDNWDGQGVYTSDNLVDWKRQPQEILDTTGGTGTDDATNGNHADVVVRGDKAYIFYFTHPERIAGNRRDDYTTRRSSVQVTELEYHDGIVTCNRNKPVYINLYQQ